MPASGFAVHRCSWYVLVGCRQLQSSLDGRAKVHCAQVELFYLCSGMAAPVCWDIAAVCLAFRIWTLLVPFLCVPAGCIVVMERAFSILPPGQSRGLLLVFGSGLRRC